MDDIMRDAADAGSAAGAGRLRAVSEDLRHEAALDAGHEARTLEALLRSRAEASLSGPDDAMPAEHEAGDEPGPRDDAPAEQAAAAGQPAASEESALAAPSSEPELAPGPELAPEPELVPEGAESVVEAEAALPEAELPQEGLPEADLPQDASPEAQLLEDVAAEAVTVEDAPAAEEVATAEEPSTAAESATAEEIAAALAAAEDTLEIDEASVGDPEDGLPAVPPLESVEAVARMLVVLLLSQRDGASVLRLAQACNTTQKAITEALPALEQMLQATGVPIELLRTGDSLKLISLPETFPFLQRLRGVKKLEKLSPAALAPATPARSSGRSTARPAPVDASSSRSADPDPHPIAIDRRGILWMSRRFLCRSPRRFAELFRAAPLPPSPCPPTPSRSIFSSCSARSPRAVLVRSSASAAASCSSRCSRSSSAST